MQTQLPLGLAPDRLAADLTEHGYATVPLLDAAICRELTALYDDDARFRSRVVMQRHNFGRGEYKYLAYPLPEPVAAVRAALYPPLAAIANAWRAALGEAARFPPALDEFLAECHAAGQTRPTPLLLRYGEGDYNCLHQDLYGPLNFPLQVAILLSEPARHDGTFQLLEPRNERSRSLVACLWTLASHHWLLVIVNASWQPPQGAVDPGPMATRARAGAGG